MRKCVIIIIVACLIQILICSCDNGEDSVNSTILGKGNLGGHINPRTEYNDDSDTNDYSGCNISLEGTTYFTVTDSVGNWIINELDEGEYNVIYNKIGYSHFKDYDVIIKKDYTKTLSQNLYKLPTARIFDLNVQLGNGEIEISAKLYSKYRQLYHCRFFISNDPNILNTLTNYTIEENVGITLFHAPDTVNVEKSISLSTIYNNGIPPGTRIYIIANVDYSSLRYKDKVTGKYVYSVMSEVPSNKVSIVIP
ncbi:MAG: hypothetical protein JW917_11580 [Ignavibacteria bacterium]|nr:hypothetical protein [Ignavibacteria bacterium]